MGEPLRFRFNDLLVKVGDVLHCDALVEVVGAWLLFGDAFRPDRTGDALGFAFGAFGALSVLGGFCCDFAADLLGGIVDAYTITTNCSPKSTGYRGCSHYSLRKVYKLLTKV